MRTLSAIEVTHNGIILNGKLIHTAGTDLNSMFRELIGEYPKFFKMDSLSKLGFIAAELILGDIEPAVKENAAVILFNRSGSLITDRNYEKTIKDKDNYYPSPAIFVYTLANIVTGEIAIRHKIFGETSFFILDKEDWNEIDSIAEGAFLTSNPSFILTGWVEYTNDSEYKAKLKIITNNQ